MLLCITLGKFQWCELDRDRYSVIVDLSKKIKRVQKSFKNLRMVISLRFFMDIEFTVTGQKLSKIKSISYEIIHNDIPPSSKLVGVL